MCTRLETSQNPLLSKSSRNASTNKSDETEVIAAETDRSSSEQIYMGFFEKPNAVCKVHTQQHFQRAILKQNKLPISVFFSGAPSKTSSWKNREQ